MSVFHAAIILAKIVIVPGCEDGLSLQALEKATAFQQRILFLHHRDTAFVGVYVVSHEDEEITRKRQRAVEHGVLMGIETRAKEDIADRLFLGGARSDQT